MATKVKTTHTTNPQQLVQEQEQKQKLKKSKSLLNAKTKGLLCAISDQQDVKISALSVMTKKHLTLNLTIRTVQPALVDFNTHALMAPHKFSAMHVQRALTIVNLDAQLLSSMKTKMKQS